MLQKKIISNFEVDSLIAIKGKINADELGLIIKADKIFFQVIKKEPINFDSL